VRGFFQTGLNLEPSLYLKHYRCVKTLRDGVSLLVLSLSHETHPKAADMPCLTKQRIAEKMLALGGRWGLRCMGDSPGDGVARGAVKMGTRFVSQNRAGFCSNSSMKTRTRNCVHCSVSWSLLFLLSFLITCFALLPNAPAVSPAPDGGYPNRNTAEGENALQSNTTGRDDTAVGYNSLGSNTTGQYNHGQQSIRPLWYHDRPAQHGNRCRCAC